MRVSRLICLVCCDHESIWELIIFWMLWTVSSKDVSSVLLHKEIVLDCSVLVLYTHVVLTMGIAVDGNDNPSSDYKLFLWTLISKMQIISII